MRIIGGKCKGMKLKGHFDIRPTLDRIKETLFNLIQFQVEEANVLDLFSGNGSLGIEALSRYAKQATFVEVSKRNFKVLQENIEKAKLTEKASLVLGDAFHFELKEQYDLIFIDPPFIYHTNEPRFPALLERCRAHLTEEGIIALEHPKEVEIPLPAPKKVKVFHNTALTLVYAEPSAE